MEYKFLPEKVKSCLRAAGAAGEPLTILRSSGSLNGQPGESYLLAYPDTLYIVSRQLGRSDYELLSGRYAQEITALTITNAAASPTLDCRLDNADYRFKFAAFDMPAAEALVKLWHTAAETTTPSPPTTAAVQSGSLSPFAALAAGMMYIAGSDNQIADCEEHYIRQVYNGRKGDLREGVEFYQQHDFNAFCHAVKSFTQPQKLCIFANMLELAMNDGVLHTCEQNIVQGFIDNCELDREQAGRIIDALEIKNHTAILIEATDDNE